MTRALAIALLVGTWPAAALAQIVFEPEDEPPSGITFEPEEEASSGIRFESEDEVPPAEGPVFEPERPTTPPADATPPGWAPPVLSLGLTSRLGVDTRFDRGGENAGFLLHRARTGVDLKRGDLTVRLGLRLRWLTSAEARSEGPFLLLNGARRRSWVEPLFGENFVALRRWGVDWTLGWQEVAWGQNPAMAAADVLNPFDVRDGPSSLEPRLPAPMARVRGVLGGFRWDAVWLPIFVPSRLPLLGNDWSPLSAPRSPLMDPSAYMDPSTYPRLEPNLLATRYPHDDLTAPQGALRLARRAGAFDLALTWAEVFDRQPRITLSPAADRFNRAWRAGDLEGVAVAGAELAGQLQQGQSAMTADYIRTRVLAFDAAALTGSVRWTFDGAWSPRRAFATTNLSSVVRPVLAGTFGFEWDGPLLLVGGLHSMRIYDVPADDRLLFLERADTEERRRDVVFTLLYATAMYTAREGRLRTALALMLTPGIGDLFAIPFIDWRLDDVHSIGVGAHLSVGPPEGMGGHYRRNSEVFAQYSAAL